MIYVLLTTIVSFWKLKRWNGYIFRVEHVQKDNVRCGQQFNNLVKHFCYSLNKEQAISSSHHQQSNGQVEACIKLITHTMKKGLESGSDIHIALLQIRQTPLEQGLPSPATLLFNCPVICLMLIIVRLPINTDNDDKTSYNISKQAIQKWTRHRYFQEFCFSFNRVYCSGSMRRQGTMDPWNNRGQRQSQPSWQIMENMHHQKQEE